MVSASELRIGNWLYDFTGTPVRVIRITEGKFALETPIPLSAEILEKCGFEKRVMNWVGYIGDEYYELPSGWTILYDGVGGYTYGEIDEYVESIGVPFKYLHQLQNLYFALTNQELSITL